MSLYNILTVVLCSCFASVGLPVGCIAAWTIWEDMQREDREAECLRLKKALFSHHQRQEELVRSAVAHQTPVEKPVTLTESITPITLKGPPLRVRDKL